MNHILGDAACSWGRRGKGYVILKHLLPGCKVMLKGGSVSKGYRGHFEEVSTGQSWIVWESNRWVDTWVRRGSSASWWWTESHHLASIIDGSAVKNPPVSPEDAGSISWVGKIPWWRKWQPTPVFLPEEFHGQRSLAGLHFRGSQSQTHLSNWTITTNHHSGAWLTRESSITGCLTKNKLLAQDNLIDYQGKVVSLWWGNLAGMGLTRWMWLASPVEGILAIPPWRGALSRAQCHASGVIAKKVGPEAGRASCRMRGLCSVKDMGVRRILGDHFTLARHWWGVTTCCPGWDPGPEGKGNTLGQFTKLEWTLCTGLVV